MIFFGTPRLINTETNDFLIYVFLFRHFTLCVFSCMLPGTVVLVLGFFAILHSWLNAFAEMTRFADRMFYKVCWHKFLPLPSLPGLCGRPSKENGRK